MALTRSGYLLVSGPLPTGLAAADLVVANGRLRMRNGAPELPADLDSCVVAIEHRASLIPEGDARASTLLAALSGLPFHERWKKVASLLVQRKTVEAEEGLLALRAEVVASPDLSEEDRLLAIGAYDAYAKPLAAAPDGEARRSARSGTPVTGLKAIAAALTCEPATAKALNTIAVTLQRTSAPAEPPEAFADEVLARAITSLRAPMREARANGVRAAVLANAISIGTAARP